MRYKYKFEDRVQKFNFKLKSYSGVHLGFLCINFYMKCLGIHPLSSTVSKLWARFYNLLWYFYLINYLLIVFPTFYAFGSSIQHIAVATYSFMEGLCMMESIILLIHFKYYKSHFKVCIIKRKFFVLQTSNAN